MSWLYTFFYGALLATCITQSFYPIFMLVAMFLRQSRLLYSLFHKVPTDPKRHGGELVAQVFKSHGIENIFTLPGGHVSPIVVAADKLKMRVIDVRHEATAVFAADATARLTGIPGVAVVTAGPGLTNTVTAIKNAQMAESPVVVVAGAAATMLKNRGSLQDIDQLSLLKSCTKKCFSVDCVRDIAPTLREAFRLAKVGVPGPVLVELPVDILYPYPIISQQFASISPNAKKSSSLKSRLVAAYANYSLNHIFADAWKEREYDPLPVTIETVEKSQLKRAASILSSSTRPLVVLGSQATSRPFGLSQVIQCIKELGVPIYLNGAARGLMGPDYELQFRHARKEALREADCVLLLGAICDFRLSYGRIFKKGTKIISVNQSIRSAKLNANIFWNPTLAIQSDVAMFISELSDAFGKKPLKVEQAWLKTLRERDHNRDKAIAKMAEDPVDANLNPLKLLLKIRDSFMDDDTVLVADGGDFVASASYILKPKGPLRWLDPGPFGTLGCGAGFALAAKLVYPNSKVLAIMGDGAFGYAIPELDTLVRHRIPIYWLVGNDACWTQIAREQVPMLGSPIGCELGQTNYHEVAKGFGAKGYLISENSKLAEVINKASKDVESTPVVVNALIGKTAFREGSISI